MAPSWSMIGWASGTLPSGRQPGPMPSRPRSSFIWSATPRSRATTSGLAAATLVALADVGVEVVEFALGQMQLPRAAADGFQLQAAVVVERVVRRLGVRLAGQQRPDVAAVDLAVGGQLRRRPASPAWAGCRSCR